MTAENQITEGQKLINSIIADNTSAYLLVPFAQPKKLNASKLVSEELNKKLQSEWFDKIRLTDELVLIIDEEGRMKACAPNPIASQLLWQYKPEFVSTAIVGRAIVRYEKA